MKKETKVENTTEPFKIAIKFYLVGGMNGNLSTGSVLLKITDATGETTFDSKSVLIQDLENGWNEFTFNCPPLEDGTTYRICMKRDSVDLNTGYAYVYTHKNLYEPGISDYSLISGLEGSDYFFRTYKGDQIDQSCETSSTNYRYLVYEAWYFQEFVPGSMNP